MVPQRVSQCGVLLFLFFLLSLGGMLARGFYTTVRESIVYGFSMATDPQGMRWYLCATVVPSFLGRGVPSNALVQILVRRVGVFLLLTWLRLSATLVMTWLGPKIYLIRIYMKKRIMIRNLCNQTKDSTTPWITFMTQSFSPLYSLSTFQTVHIIFEALNARSTCILVERRSKYVSSN